jgi:hypothetical protein
MKRSRFTEEQIIGVLEEHQAGVSAADICRRHGISEATFYTWRSKYGGLEVSEARRLKALSCSPLQAAGTENLSLIPEPFSTASAGQGRRHDHETTVDHALIRGLVTAGPVMRRGASSV